MQTKQTKPKNFSNHRNAFEQSIKKSKLSPLQKLIALLLNSYTNNSTGLCNPSIKTLMVDSGIKTKTTVNNCITALENAGFITKITGNGRGNSTRYTLHIIESDVDNRNKHKGNTQNLEPNYSYETDVNPDDYTQEDFDIEVPSSNPVLNITDSEANMTKEEYYPDHLENLDYFSREKAEWDINKFGYYFNEPLRRHLYADGRRVADKDVDF